MFDCTRRLFFSVLALALFCFSDLLSVNKELLIHWLVYIYISFFIFVTCTGWLTLVSPIRTLSKYAFHSDLYSRRLCLCICLHKLWPVWQSDTTTVNNNNASVMTPSEVKYSVHFTILLIYEVSHTSIQSSVHVRACVHNAQCNTFIIISYKSNFVIKLRETAN